MNYLHLNQKVQAGIYASTGLIVIEDQPPPRSFMDVFFLSKA